MRWIPASERLPDLVDAAKRYVSRYIKIPEECQMRNYYELKSLLENSYEVEWLDEQSDEWISVEKELPEIYKPVLICEPPINDHDDWTMAVSYWDGTYEKINGKKLPRFPDGQDEQPGWHNAAYWELLPQPPKQ